MSIDNLVGRSIGQYQLVELMGVGAMGAVYRAYQTTLEREVAVKLLPSSLASQPDYVARFNREAKIAASLEHPHIVPLHDYGTKNGMSYLVMRYLSGGTLAHRLNQRAIERGPLPSLGETASLLRQVAGALDYAHRKGVIHRDMKPNNVMFDEDGSAYIVDFGIARLVNVTTAITGNQTVFGTPHYMPPEQWRDEELGPETDQYALGVVIYSLVTGEPPFDAPTPHALMYKHFHEEPPPPTSKRADLPEALNEVLLRPLAKLPSERYLTTTEFSRAFDAAIVGEEGEPTGFFTFPISEAVKEMLMGEAAVMPEGEPQAKRFGILESDNEIPIQAPPPQMLPPVPIPPSMPYPSAPQPSSVLPAPYAASRPRVQRRVPPVALAIIIGMVILGLIICASLAVIASRLDDFQREQLDSVDKVTEITATFLPPTNISIALTSVEPSSTFVGSVIGDGSVQERPQTTRTERTPEFTPTQRSVPSTATQQQSPQNTPTTQQQSQQTTPTQLPAIGGVTALPTFAPSQTPGGGTSSGVPTSAITLVPIAEQGTPIAAANAANVSQIALMAHGVAPVRGVAFSPDGSILATGAADGAIRLWSPSGTAEGEMNAGAGVAYSIAYSPDGQYIASGHEDGTVRIWNVAQQAQVGVLTGHSAPVRAVAFSPDGSLVASASEDKTARLWEAASGAQRVLLDGQTDRVLAIAFSADSRQVATASDDGNVRIYNAATGAALGSLPSGDGEARDLAFSPINNQLAVASTDGLVHIWDLSTGQQVGVLQGHDSWVWTVRYSPDGSLLATGGRDNTARLWDAATFQQVAILRGHGGWVISVAFSPDGSMLATGGGDGTARVWNVG
jgi:serine/threonine protein kinase